MKKSIFVSLMVLAAVFAFQTLAMAETISGKIASIDAVANKLSLSISDPATGNPANLDVLISTSTTYAGVASLADLKEGQEVSVEVAKDEATGANNATSVTLSQPAEEAAAPAEQPAEAPKAAAE